MAGFFVTTYLSILCLIAAASLAIGWRLGRRLNGGKNLSPLAAGMLLTVGILWLLTAKFARSYADTDGLGSDFAGWFAHSGKWLVLFGAMLLGHGWICGARQIPSRFTQRIFYHVALLGMLAFAISRTIPIFFLLDAGQRDKTGCLRQSQKVETTCAAVALLNYLERYQNHPPLTEREVARACGVTMEGTTTSALLRAAKHFGQTNATARVLTFEELKIAKLPVIVSISTLPTVHHATLLIELDAERARFIDPAYGFWEIPRARFEEIWYGKTVLLE